MAESEEKPFESQMAVACTMQEFLPTMHASAGKTLQSVIDIPSFPMSCNEDRECIRVLCWCACDFLSFRLLDALQPVCSLLLSHADHA